MAGLSLALRMEFCLAGSDHWSVLDLASYDLVSDDFLKSPRSWGLSHTFPLLGPQSMLILLIPFPPFLCF